MEAYVNLGLLGKIVNTIAGISAIGMFVGICMGYGKGHNDGFKKGFRRGLELGRK